jgi:hypothetical protein
MKTKGFLLNEYFIQVSKLKKIVLLQHTVFEFPVSE